MERDRLKSQKGIELYKIEKSDTEKEASLTTNLALIALTSLFDLAFIDRSDLLDHYSVEKYERPQNHLIL
ncbi:hypothetical protein GLYMA_09G048000v4 [Glycine max]|uniref:Uncharacterized protein n=2 Tax=Glycine subgen. Soja TaxID=1462606 RepID=A0A0R0I3Y6_SOYBN|nr:hypothetical protein JHK85_024604 [Glycine max]KAG5011856.1 hypothetical protein JHK86_024117 [Glycine max]KAH1041508.1 hypothetical protein GYH30_024057 [Glycine max]KRH37153.1 hypothetical protein GLYMA_09G048000v4 [Glycine max]RZB90628.1 hypothetical protein D0Y65_023204 [Glycine soja]